MISRIRPWHGLALSMALLGFARAGPVRAETITYLVTVLDTSAYLGTTGSLDFQLNALGPGASDTVAITSFSGGVPGSVNFTAGDVSGSLSSLPLIITDDQVNNEQNQAFTYGSSIPFLMTLATFSGTPGASFFFTMYDQNGTPIDAGPNGLSAVEIDADTGTGLPGARPGRTECDGANPGSGRTGAVVRPAAVDGVAGRGRRIRREEVSSEVVVGTSRRGGAFGVI